MKLRYWPFITYRDESGTVRHTNTAYGYDTPKQARAQIRAWAQSLHLLTAYIEALDVEADPPRVYRKIPVL